MPRLSPSALLVHVQVAVTVTDGAEYLSSRREAILDAAGAALVRARAPHYRSAGPLVVRLKLGTLFDELLSALRNRDLGPVLLYARRVAQERFGAGYDLSEVQTGFNVLEEAIWTSVFAELEPAELAETLGLVSTALGAAKDALACEYVSLATHTHVPTLDLRALFAGTEGQAGDGPPS